jgi:serine/threonine protein kinase
MTGPVAPNALPVGFILNNRYEVLAPLGGGANGAVYEVRDHNTGQISALKLLLTFNPTAPWEEAHILTGLEGEFILPVRNADVANGLPFLVTPVASHGTLADKIVTGVGVSTNDAVRWVRQATQGIARIHDLGLLHNDIKPDNIFLDADGDALVGDLGLASLRDIHGHGPFAGTPSTMAPEVATIGATVPQADWQLHRPTSAASDIYSLGATLYWLLAGHPPHHDPTGGIATMASVAAGPPPDLFDIAPHIPQGLRDIVHKAMSRNPADRYPIPAAFDAALGSRTRQVRTWSRIPPHPGHVTCFTGTGNSSGLAVCAVRTGPRSRHQIQIRHVASGRRVAPWPTVPAAGLSRALRATFRKHA